MNHPLRFYFELIEKGEIKKITSDFFHVDGVKLQYFQDYGEFVNVQWIKSSNKYKISIFKSDNEPNEIDLTLNMYLNDILESENNKIKETIRAEVLHKDQHLQNTFLATLTKEINYLTYLTPNLKSTIVDTIIANLNLLSEFIESYSTVKVSSIIAIQKQKLKWLGKINTLATLFYDLSNEDNNLKKKLIEYDNTILTNFIVQNFVDESGDTFSESTIYTYLNEKRGDKRAKKEKLLIRESLECGIPFEEKPSVRKVNKTYKSCVQQISLPKHQNPDNLK